MVKLSTPAKVGSENPDTQSHLITPKGVYLLTMGRFNRGLVLNKFFMDKIKYGWNILSSHTK
jgi:hypothetical protein